MFYCESTVKVIQYTSTVTKKGMITLPAKLRRKYMIKGGSKVKLVAGNIYLGLSRNSKGVLTLSLDELLKRVKMKDLKAAAKEQGIKLGRCPTKRSIAEKLPREVLEKLAK